MRVPWLAGTVLVPTCSKPFRSSNLLTGTLALPVSMQTPKARAPVTPADPGRGPSRTSQTEPRGCPRSAEALTQGRTRADTWWSCQGQELVTCGATMGGTCPIGWMFLTAEEYLYCGAPRSRVGEEGIRVLTVCVPMLAAMGMGTFVRRSPGNTPLCQGG